MIWIGLRNGSKKNGMEFARDKCLKKTFRGSDQSFNILDQKLVHSRTVKDLGIYVSDNLTWKVRINERLLKAKKVLNFAAETLQ